ncbi:hypothetical protein [Tardiphaga sp.]|uniref:hypothetical protein n=1 Tax=Tardiphaga sp. TaxID=1926292 RepID=UPI00260C4083|nr:hypothetical protein [Tardiphaga sp.]MDB5620086.1 hypothetical protein [Tardiphaga sp.]
MTPKPNNEFGKRPPRLSPDEPPAAAKKRSGHIALLLMGTAALGGGAYALMPRQNCDPNQPVLAADQPADCRQPSSSSGGHGGSGSSSSARSNFASTETSSSRTAISTDAGHVTRGGFGSFMSHFSGGG